MALPTPAAAVLELMTKGQQSAAHLGELLVASSPHGQALAAEILRCCNRVIAAVSGAAAAAGDKKRKVADRGAAACPDDLLLPPSKRRAARGAVARRVLEAGTAADDGFVWRKYGQKDINGSKHPRFYYRCAYSGEGCGATRRVQQSRDEPAAFVIAYYGDHTCRDGAGDACQQGAAPAATVVDYARNAWGGGAGVDQNGGSPLLPLLHTSHSMHCHGEVPGETSRGRWSSASSSSSEAELGSSPVLEFLERSLGWESVVNYLGSGDLPQTGMLR